MFCLMKVGVSVRTVIATRQGRLCLSPKALPTIFFTVTSFLLVVCGKGKKGGGGVWEGEVGKGSG